jgi:hypothetical protein
MIDPSKCFTKAAFARHIKRSDSWVGKLVKANRIKTIPINGGELVYVD